MSKKLQLGISALAVMVAGPIYGFDPGNLLTDLLGLEGLDADLSNVFKAIMGLYWAMGIFWIVGMARPAYWRAATLSNVFFMGGIAFGRGVSLFLDGFSLHFAIAMVLELLMMFWGLRNLAREKGMKSAS